MRDKLYDNTMDNTAYKYLSCRFYIYTLLFLLVNCLLCHYGCVGFCDYCGVSRNSGSSVRGSENKQIEIVCRNNKVTITYPNGDLTLEKTTEGKVDDKKIVNGKFVNKGGVVYCDRVGNENTYGAFIDYLKSKNGEAIYVESGFWRLLFLGEQMKESTTYLFALVTVNNFQYIVYCENANSIEENVYLHGLFDGSSATKIEILSCGKNITNMRNMFVGCNKLTELDLSKLKTGKVTDMSSMFSYCNSLSELNLSNFDTSKVKNMSYMFYNCSSLPELNLSKFNTSNVKNMSYMFYNCNSLPELNLSKFVTGAVTDMSYMFYNCSKLTGLNLSNWNTSNVTNMSNMFYECSSLTVLDLSSFKTNNVENMSYMFYNCSSLQNLDLSKWDTGNVTNMNSMFNNCSSLQKLYLSNFNTSNVKNINDMFYNCFKEGEKNTLICPEEVINNITSENILSSLNKGKVNIDDDTLYECTVERNENDTDVTITGVAKIN